MSEIKKNQDREYRIIMEVVVDAYDRDERAIGWYYYISDNCHFPFKAKCTVKRRTSPLNINDEVDVVDTSPAGECKKEILVDINWNSSQLSVPLSQLEGININAQTNEVIEDWHYWIKRGYEF